MTTRRNKHAFPPGKTSQAYKSTRYSLLSLRAYQFEPGTHVTANWELLTKYEKRRGLTRKNICTMLRRKLLLLSKFRHRYYVKERDICRDEIELYINYKRRNRHRIPTI